MEPRVSIDIGDPTTVRLSGDLDLACVPILKRLLGPMARAGRDVILDLSGVGFLDCSGLTALLRAGRAVQARGGSLTLRHVSPRVRRVIELTGAPLALCESIDTPNPPSRQGFTRGALAADRSAALFA